jgi:hypothetical protein
MRWVDVRRGDDKLRAIGDRGRCQLDALRHRSWAVIDPGQQMKVQLDVAHSLMIGVPGHDSVTIV